MRHILSLYDNRSSIRVYFYNGFNLRFIRWCDWSFLCEYISHYLRIGIRLCKSKINAIIIKFKFHFKYKCIIVKCSLLTKQLVSIRIVIHQSSCCTREIFWVTSCCFLSIIIPIEFFYFFVLVRIYSCCKHILFPSCNPRFNISYLLRTYCLPFLTTAQIWLVKYPLLKLILLVSRTTCYTWLCKIHYME